MSTTKIVNGLNYNLSNRLGECGAFRSSSKKKLYFPMFFMGACGNDTRVVKHDGKREVLVAPKVMNYNWFHLLAKKIKENPLLDYDWASLRNNILEPNKEHIKEALQITDEKMDRLLMDGYVFLNHFEDNWDAEDEVEAVEIGHYPNFKNFLEYDELEY